ncbi:MAG: hypothetical protein LBT89_05875, partial [Planctomycetaceae bacterium]|nr:hypothetical protein [Planctomycetaceae bacterium]
MTQVLQPNVPVVLTQALTAVIDTAAVETLIREACGEADKFFEQVDCCSDDSVIDAAKKDSTDLLSDRVTSALFLEKVCGGNLQGNPLGFLQIHLKSLLVPPVYPKMTQV